MVNCQRAQQRRGGRGRGGTPGRRSRRDAGRDARPRRQGQGREGGRREARPARPAWQGPGSVPKWPRHFSDVGHSNADRASEGPRGFTAAISVTRPSRGLGRASRRAHGSHDQSHVLAQTTQAWPDPQCFAPGTWAPWTVPILFSEIGHQNTKDVLAGYPTACGTSTHRRRLSPARTAAATWVSPVAPARRSLPRGLRGKRSSAFGCQHCSRL